MAQYNVNVELSSAQARRLEREARRHGVSRREMAARILLAELRRREDMKKPAG